MYYLWLNEAQAGPYTLHQVQSMWNEGQITGLTLYWQEGNADWQPLSTIQSTIEPVRPADLEKTAVMPTIQQVFVKKVHDQEAAQAELSLTSATTTPATTHEEHVEWMGYPTWWKWISLLILVLVLCLAPVALIVFAILPVLLALIPLPIASAILAYIYFARISTKYTVSNKRISVESGIFNKTSRELRIQDIRSIAAKINFLGYGNIEFSSASDEVDVTFAAVSGAAKVRDLVKKLQA